MTSETFIWNGREMCFVLVVICDACTYLLSCQVCTKGIDLCKRIVIIIGSWYVKKKSALIIYPDNDLIGLIVF